MTQVLAAPAVHVDETGWRTKGDARALWTANAPSAVFLQSAEHCNHEVFDALIGTTYPRDRCLRSLERPQPSRPDPPAGVLVASTA